MNVRVAEVGTQGRWSRIGLLSLLSVMILVVSVGQTFAADLTDYKLWHKLENGEVGQALKHRRTDDSEVARNENRLDEQMLRNQTGSGGFSAFVVKYQEEPFMFMEGIQKVLLTEANKTSANDGRVMELLTAIRAGIDRVAEDAYSAPKRFERRNAYKKLLEKLADKLSRLSKDEQKRLLQDPEFLKKLFDGDEALLIELDLAKEKAEKKDPTPTPTVTPTATPSPTASSTPVVDEEARRRQEETARKIEELRQEIRAQRDRAPQGPQQPRIGEQDDSARRAQPVYSCNNDQAQQVQKALNDFQQKFISPIKDALAKAVNDDAAKNPFQFLNQANQKQKEDKQLADVLLPLLQEQNKNNAVVPPAPQPPSLPQRQQTADNSNQTNPGLNQPIQPEQPQQQQPLPPLQFPSSQSTALQMPVRVDLPSHSYRREVSDANSVISESQRLLKQPVPNPMLMNGQQLPPPFALQMLEPDQRNTANLLSRASSELETVKDARAKLDDQLEQLKDGARSSLDPRVKQEEQRLQSEAETAKKNFEQRKQFAQQAAQDPQLRDQIQAQMMQEQQEVTNKEQELAKFRQKIDAAVESGNKDIAVLKQNSDRLAKAEKDLSSQVDQLTSRKTDLDNKIQQQYMTMMQPPQQQQQPQTQNVNRISQMGSRPSTRTSQISSAMPQRSGAGVMRGSLGGALGSMSATGASSATSAQ